MEKRVLNACTSSIYRKEFWIKKLDELNIEYEVTTKTCIDTWWDFKIQVNLAGKDLNYGKICNELCIPDEMIIFAYKE